MTLLADIGRCRDDDCPERDDCQRYIARLASKNSPAWVLQYRTLRCAETGVCTSRIPQPKGGN